MVALLILLAMPSALAQEDASPPTTLVIHDERGRAWTTEPDAAIEFVELAFYPGGPSTLIVRNEGERAHEVHFGTPLDVSTGPIPPGASKEMTLTIPDDADFEARYWLDRDASYAASGWVTTFGLLYGVPHCHGDLCPHDGHAMLDANVTRGGVVANAVRAWPPLELKAPGYGMIMLRNLDDAPHVLRIGGPVQKATDPIAPGDVGSLRFTLTQPASFAYWLDDDATVSGAIRPPAPVQEVAALPLALMLGATALAATGRRR